MTATSNVIDQEKMAVIIQEVVGENRGGGAYFPSFSGVGRSLNYYPLGDERAEDGVVQVAVGLGKYIVDGGQALRFSPRHPASVLQTSTLDLALRDTQTRLDALELASTTDDMTVDDGYNIVRRRVQDFADTACCATWCRPSTPTTARPRLRAAGPLATCGHIQLHAAPRSVPLAEAADFMLSAGQNEMRRPVEIEFAGNVFPTPGKDGLKGHIYWLQIRPIIDKKDMVDDDIIDVDDSRVILKSATALGHGNIDNVDTIVYVRPETFNSRNNGEVAEEIERINREFIAQGKNYALIGPAAGVRATPRSAYP